MSKADDAVLHILRRIRAEPRLAYYLDPMTEAFNLLTEAYAESQGRDPELVRKEVAHGLVYQPPGDA